MDALRIQHCIDRIELVGFDSQEGQGHWMELKQFLQEDHISDVAYYDLERLLKASEEKVDEREEAILLHLSDVENLAEQVKDLRDKIQNAKDALNA